MELAARKHSNFAWRREQLESNIVLFEISGSPSDEGITEFLAEVESFFRSLESRASKICAVVDLAQMATATASHRSLLGNWRVRHQALIANAVERAAYIAPSAMMRGMLTAIFWFARPVVPVQVSKDRQEALAWLRASSVVNEK